MRACLVLIRREAKKRFEAGMPPEAAARDIKLGVYASWREGESAQRDACYQEFRDETDEPRDVAEMLAGMERLRGRTGHHTCL